MDQMQNTTELKDISNTCDSKNHEKDTKTEKQKLINEIIDLDSFDYGMGNISSGKENKFPIQEIEEAENCSDEESNATEECDQALIPTTSSATNQNFQIKNKRLIRTILSKQKSTGYLKFYNEKRREIYQANPNLQIAQVTFKVAEIWNKLDEKSKQKYFGIAKKEKEYYTKLESKIPDKILSKLQTKRAAKVKIYWGGQNSDFESDGGDISDTGIIKPPTKPKLPLSVYRCFWKVQKELLAKSNPDFTTQERDEEISSRYKSLTQEERYEYRKMANDDKKRYQNEHNLFIKQSYVFDQMVLQQKRK